MIRVHGGDSARCPWPVLEVLNSARAIAFWLHISLIEFLSHIMAILYKYYCQLVHW